MTSTALPWTVRRFSRSSRIGSTALALVAVGLVAVPQVLEANIVQQLTSLLIFLILAGYYLLKTIREPLILASPGGAEAKSYSAAAIAGLLIFLVPAYSALASRV